MNTPSSFPEFSNLIAAITLPADAIDWAIDRSQTLATEADPWTIYLRSLALMGVKHWLEDGITPFNLTWDDPLPVDASLTVNGFRLGIVPMGSLPPDPVLIPVAAVQGDQPVHFWLLVEVQEELDQVMIRWGLQGNQIPTLAPHPIAEHYPLPLSSFTIPPERLLVYLSQLTPALLTYSTPPLPAGFDSLSPTGRQSQRQSSGQAAQPANLLPHSPTPPLPHSPLTDLSNWVINTGQWLQGQIGDVAQHLAWTLIEPTPAFRSPTEELDAILMELRPQGLTIPPRARAGYTELSLAAMPIRCYTVVWQLFETGIPEWSLLVILGPTEDTLLPAGITLRMRDPQSLLSEQTLSAQAETTHLFGQVFGTWDEIFTVEISLAPQGVSLTLPTFRFHPEE